MKSLRAIAFACFLLLSSNSFGQDIRDVKSPVDFPPNYWLLGSILFISLVLISIILFKYLKSHPRKVKSTTQIIKTPWEVALEEITQLQKSSLLDDKKFNEYFDRLSDIIRRYFEARFSIRAPEMTTEEFLNSLKGSRVLTKEQEKIMQDFLSACDLVKFADHLPEAREIDQGVELAQTLIHQTKLEIHSQT